MISDRQYAEALLFDQGQLSYVTTILVAAMIDIAIDDDATRSEAKKDLLELREALEPEFGEPVEKHLEQYRAGYIHQGKIATAMVDAALKALDEMDESEFGSESRRSKMKGVALEALRAAMQQVLVAIREAIGTQF